MNEKKNIILDVDGVIFDSNGLKEKNIYTATKEYCGDAVAKDFATYFTSYNGLPRKLKIDTYFAGDAFLAKNILVLYNELNDRSLKEVQFTSGAEDAISTLHASFNLYALSGGELIELTTLFGHKNIRPLFKEIMGGPATKDENLRQHRQQQFAWFVGDSKVDHEVAVKNNTPFIFMHGYSQFSDWENYFKDHPAVIIIKDLQELSKTIN